MTAKQKTLKLLQQAKDKEQQRIKDGVAKWIRTDKGMKLITI